MLHNDQAIKINLSRKILTKRFLIVFFLLISLYFGFCSAQDSTQILVDLKECKSGEQYVVWGLGSEHTKVLGIEVIEEPGFVSEQACSIEHTTEVEGGYMISSCIFPSSYSTLIVKQEFDIYLGTKPLTAYEAIRYCKLVKAGNIFLDAMRESESSE